MVRIRNFANSDLHVKVDIKTDQTQHFCTDISPTIFQKLIISNMLKEVVLSGLAVVSLVAY